MAATFPYRGVPGGMPPGVPPPIPVPDYMSEEKLQEKGMLALLVQKVPIVVKTGNVYVASDSFCCHCPPTQQQENGSTCRLSATQKRESLALWMPRRKTCHLSMSARSSGTMET